jgi:hypothetical protein
MSASSLCLPEGYRENAAALADPDGTAYWSDELSNPILQDRSVRWQEPVYRYASRGMTGAAPHGARRRLRDRPQAREALCGQG